MRRLAVTLLGLTVTAVAVGIAAPALVSAHPLRGRPVTRPSAGGGVAPPEALGMVDHGPPLPARTPGPTALTDRDLVVLLFLAEHRILLPAHVAALLGVTDETAKARLMTLLDAGYVTCRPLLRDQPSMYLIRQAGLDVTESTLKPPRVNLNTYAHDVGVAWLWLAAHRGTLGALSEIVGERRLRSHDATRDANVPPLAVRLGGVGPGGRERLHYPDLMLTTADGRRIALELELSSKGRVRLGKILAGYGADQRIDGVVYLVERQTVARAVQEAARRVGVSHLVHLQRVRSTVSNPAGAEATGVQRAAPTRRRQTAERRGLALEGGR